MEDEMGLDQEPLSGNDDIQEWLLGPLWQPSSSSKPTLNWNIQIYILYK